jgi:hypothetical protein
VDKAQRTLLAVCFLVLLGGGLWSRLTPVEVGGTDCADPPTELTSECFDAQGDRSRVQIAVSGTLLTGTYVSVRLIGRRSRTGDQIPPPARGVLAGTRGQAVST